MDDDGQLHMKWDNGRTLALDPWRGQLYGASAQAGNAETLCTADRSILYERNRLRRSTKMRSVVLDGRSLQTYRG
ncbi:MAG: hypothetical protein ACLUN5_08790 [Oscillospiraceae bacterium]